MVLVFRETLVCRIWPLNRSGLEREWELTGLPQGPYLPAGNAPLPGWWMSIAFSLTS